MDRWIDGKRYRPVKQSGFEDDQAAIPCRHPSHEPPSHLVVPAGKIYRHVCPGCGKEAILRSPQTFMYC